MKILLVEDRVADAAALSAELRQLGHEVSLSLSGDDALIHIDRQQPDLVIASAVLPGLDGFSLTQKILQRATSRWQPVILLADTVDPAIQARALEAGADACFSKPPPLGLLKARLAMIERMVLMRLETETRLTLLDRYLAAEEEDLRMARHLIEHQMAPDGKGKLDDPAVQYWQRTCTRLGGDMVAVSRAPSGVLHAMLADARGSGLSAYVSLLPIIAPFQRMTAKGFPLPTIARELNRKVRQSLPSERSVAVQMIAVDQRENIVSAWNGGMPTAVTLDGLGQHFQEFALCHPPLGALDDDAFDDRIEQHGYAAGDQVVMVSDGLLDCVGVTGERFGEQGLAQALVGLPRRQRRAEVAASLAAHLGSVQPDDDLTLVLIDCDQKAAAPDEAIALPPRRRHPGSWHFELHLGANELGHLDVVPMLLNITGQFDSTQEISGKLFVILSELFNNALDHGVLRLDSRLKLAPDGMETWLLLREERLAMLREGEIRISVDQFVESGQIWLRVCCRDSGPGYDIRAILEQVARDQGSPGGHVLPYGRGLALLQAMAYSIDFGPSGNDVKVLLAVG